MTTEYKTVRIVLADDHAILRSGLKALLDDTEGIKVIGEASNGEEAIQQTEKLQPDLVLMDISMPIKNGLEATAIITQKWPHIKVMVLTMHESEEYLFRTIRAGGSGYVLKKSADQELIEAIHHVMSDRTFLRPSVMSMLARDYLDGVWVNHDEPKEIEHLTPREMEVLKLIAEGMTNSEIAENLVISVRTVESHRSNIMDKLGVHKRSELVQYARKKGFLD